MRKFVSYYKELEKRLFILFTCFVVCTVNLFALEGNMWGAHDLRVIKTQWFDIIYEPDSADSAARLAQEADKIYEEIAGMYGYEPYLRLPVVLTSKNEQFNAYYNSQAYDRIVLYDTACIPELSVFSDELISTFRHELTHAYTFNLKDSYWRSVSAVFGSCFTPNLFILPGWAEGATLTSESSFGEGRLNDEYALHMVKQAKLENQFPAYNDMHGVQDCYPYGSYYYFNGTFNKWLQDTFGMQKYAEFWYKCDNGYTMALEICFKKVFGIKLNKAWKQYRDSFSVPEIPGNPLTDSSPIKVTDYFSGSSEKYSPKNLSGTLFDCLISCENGCAWIDAGTNSVFYNGNKLFTQYGVDKISLSKDGRFMAVSYIDYYTPVYSRKVKIYDMVHKKWTRVNGNGIMNASILSNGTDYALVLTGFKSQSKWIKIYDLSLEENGEISKITEKKVISLPYGTSPSYYTDVSGSGELSYGFIKKTGLTYTICTANINDDVVTEYSLPYDRMVLTGLSLSDDSKEFNFSWTKPGIMPRYGSLNIESGEFKLSNQDVSGGVFDPVEVSEGKIMYVGHFFRQNRLLFMDFDAGSDGLYTYFPSESKKYENELPDEDKSYLALLDDSKKYTGLNFYKGIFYPISIAQTLCLDEDLGHWKPSDSCWFGLTYITNNPWGANQVVLSGGINPFTWMNAYMVQVSGGTDTSLYSWSFTGQVENEAGKLYQAWTDYNVSFHIPLGRFPYIGISNDLILDGVNTGEYEILSNSKEPVFDLYTVSDKIDTWFTTVHKSYSGEFAYSGFTAGLYTQFYYSYMLKARGDNLSLPFTGFTPYLNFFIPKLLPIDCKNFYTYNFPLVIRNSFRVGENFGVQTNADLCLFGMEIQKGVPGIPILYVNRIYFNGGYNGLYLENDSVPYSDYAYLKGTLGITPNISSSLYTELNFQLTYLIRKREKDKNKNNLNFYFGISGAL